MKNPTHVALVTAAMACLLQCSLAVGSEKEILVQTSSLECLIAHADKYLALDKDPIVVFLDDCPQVVPDKKKLLSAASNSLPEVKTSKSDAKDSVLRILALSKEEIRCLKRMAAEKTLPKSREKVAGKSTTLISFGNCGAKEKSGNRDQTEK